MIGRLVDAWRERQRERRQVSEALATARRQLQRAVESLTSQLAADLARQEDVGWRRLGETSAGYDIAGADLKTIRERSLALWQIDPAVGQAVFLTNTGVFGQGLSAPRAADRRVQRIIDRWWNDPDNQLALTSRQAMVQTNTLLMIEGERFFTLHTSPADSRVKLGVMPCAEIQGIVTHPQNALQPVLYKRVYRPSEWDFQRGGWAAAAEQRVEYYPDWRVAQYLDPLLLAQVPREERDEEVMDLLGRTPGLQSVAIYHLRTNTVGQRGIPEVYRAYDWARAHSDVLSDMATLTKALAAIAWTLKVDSRSASVLSAAASKFASPAMGPAAVAAQPPGQTLEPVRVGTEGTSNQTQTARQMLLQEIRAFGFGEHWYGDASTGNLATATAMELPAIWRIVERQRLFEDVLRDLLDWAIERAIVMQDVVAVPRSVSRYYDLDFPPPRPSQPSEVASLLQALSGAAGVLLDPQEAAYQAYVALGTNDIEQVMARQFPPTEQLEGERPRPQGEPAADADDETGAEGLTAGQASEARRVSREDALAVPFGRTEVARRSIAQLQAAIESRIIQPWRAAIRAYLRTLPEPPPEGLLEMQLQHACSPDRRRLEQLLVQHYRDVAEAAGQHALDRVLAWRRRGLQGGEGRGREARRRQRADEWRPAETGQPTAGIAGDNMGPVAFRLRDPELLSALAERGRKITGEVTRTMLADLADVLRQRMYEEGLGPRQIAADLDTIFPRTYARRAETIARTETLFAQAVVQAETYRRNGVRAKQWVALLDDRTRDDHAAMHGVTVGIDEDFRLPTGETIAYPGDETASAEEVINCRCDFLPIFDDAYTAEELAQPWIGG